MQINNLDKTIEFIYNRAYNVYVREGKEMNLFYLRYFVTLAHVQHYTKAAEQLCIAQPSLSHAIKQMEKELGLPLLKKAGGKQRSHVLEKNFWFARSTHYPHWMRELNRFSAAPAAEA